MDDTKVEYCHQINGKGVPLPTIHVGWNAEAQDIAMTFDSDEFKTWNFLVKVLEMALDRAKEQQEFHKARNLAGMMAQQQEAQRLANGLKLGR